MKHFLLLLAAFTSTLQAPIAFAGSADECRERTNFEVAREHRLYRAYLFGKRNAEDAALNSVRYDNEGLAWIKIDDSDTPWRNSDPDNQSLEWSNTVMDENDEHADILPIVGIFETKRTSTSELIPYLLHTIRAFDCRVQALCEVARVSEAEDSEDAETIDSIQPLGCIEFTDLNTWPQCHFGEASESILDQGTTRTYCDEMYEQLMRRETDLLKLVVEYDAGYRTLLQFAGNFDIFLSELRWPLSVTLRQAVELIGQLQRIPCFLSSCDSSLP